MQGRTVIERLWNPPDWAAADGSSAHGGSCPSRLTLPAASPTVVPISRMTKRLLAAGLLGVLASVAPVRAQTPAPAETSSGLNALSQAFAALVESVRLSVVEIRTTGLAVGPADSGAGVGASPQRAGGSGVIVSTEGLIVTNAHVVAGARRIQVVLPLVSEEQARLRSILKPGGQVVDATLVGLDRETDLALLSVEGEGLTALPFGDSDSVRPGQLVLAFGSPLAIGQSVTMGVVSAVGRQRHPDDRMVYVQTDAPINPGGSGGPLVDTEGRLVGINTFILSQSGGNEGIGFAAPSNIVRAIYEQLQRDGRVRRGTIGVVAQTITPTLAAALGLARSSGVLLADVDPAGPGAAAGLQIGDIVLSLDGKPMENGRQLDVNLYSRTIGDVVTLDVLRNGTTRQEFVAVTERADDPARFFELATPQGRVDELGVIVVEIDEQVAGQIQGLRAPGGLLVAGQTALGVVAITGLEVGDIIVSLNGEPTPAIGSLRRVLERLPSGAPAALHVQRGGSLRFLAFELP